MPAYGSLRAASAEPKHPSSAQAKQPPMRGSPRFFATDMSMDWGKTRTWNPLCALRASQTSSEMSRSPEKPTPLTVCTMPMPRAAR